MQLPVSRENRLTLSMLLAVVAGVVFVGSVLPLPAGGNAPVPAPFGVGADKWVHAASYAVIGALAAGRPKRYARYGVVGLVAVVLAVTAFGAGIEVAQSVVPGRTASGGDVVANTVGAIVGVAVAVGWWAITRWRRDTRLPTR